MVLEVDVEDEGTGESMPLKVGSGAACVLDGGGTSTKSERHTPKPATTDEEPVHVVEVHVPPRKTWLELEQARQLLGPAPEQLEQLESQDWHEEEVLSKNWFLLQVGKQRPLVRTGRSEGQLEHWLKAEPEHEAQSGWQVIHAPEELNVFDGHEETHFPPEANWLLVQVKQNVEEPAQVLQDESQAVHVTLSLGSKNVSEGQLSTHCPPDNTKPGRHPVHCS